MTEPDADIKNTLYQYLADGQTLSPPLRVSYPLIAFEAGPKEIYLRCALLPAAAGFVPVGKGEEQFRGIFQVSVVGLASSDEGEIPMTQIAGAIATQFASGTKLWTDGGRKIKISQTPRVAALISDSVRPILPVSIEYRVAVSNQL
jgi:hypothetical protein